MIAPQGECYANTYATVTEANREIFQRFDG